MSEVYSKINPFGYDWSLHSFGEGPGSPYNNSVSGSFSQANSLVGSYLPNYRDIIRNGGDATTSLSGIKYTVDGSSYFSWTKTGIYAPGTPFAKGVHYAYDGRSPDAWQNPSNDVSSSLKTEIRNRAIRKFLDSAKSARSAFEAGQDLGEIKQTIESLLHPMNSLKQLTLKYFSQLTKAKGRYKKAPALHKALSDSYLEYRFGWRPLALDIADAYAGLTNSVRMTNTAPCSGSATGQERFDSFYGRPSWADPSEFLLDSNSYATYTYRIKGAIRLNLVDGRIPPLQNLQLSTLNDFAVTAWDLLPYSFVVDYFTNIGDVINAVTFPTSDLTYCVGTERTTLTNRYTFSTRQPFADPDYLWTGISIQADSPSYNIVKFSRFRLQSIDLLPSVRFSIPVRSRPWENIGALISSNIKSLVPFFK